MPYKRKKEINATTKVKPLALSRSEITQLIDQYKNYENKVVISENLGANTFRGIRKLSEGKNSFFFELTSNEKKVKHFISLRERGKFRFALGKDLFDKILVQFPRYIKNSTSLSAIQSKFETTCEGLIALLYELTTLSNQRLSRAEKIVFNRKLESLHLEASVALKCDIDEVENKLKSNYDLGIY